MYIPWHLVLAWAYASIILSYRRAWRKVVPYRAPAAFQPTTAISVIVPARDEEANITDCLQSLLSQSYPAALFEVIVVDDFSSDATADRVLALADPRIRLLRMQDVAGMDANSSSKKKAITQAVSIARNPLVVTTDADCVCPPDWLRTLSAWQEIHGSYFFAAPVRYAEGKGLLHVFQSLDFMTLQGITIAAASNGLHVMSNGANLGYVRSVFQQIGGFSGVDHIASGDDMLLQQKFVSHYPSRVSYCTSPDAIVTTKPAGTWREFFQQRVRWASKARHYDQRGLRYILIGVYLFNLLLLVLPFLGYENLFLFWSWIGMLLVKVTVELMFLVPVARFFGMTRSLWWFIPLQPLHVLYTVVAGGFGQFRSYAWKGRKVK